MFGSEDEYIFKAKGEFAAQLKALIEAHAKDGQVEIQKYEPSSNRYSNGIVNAFLNDGIVNEDISYGKTLYEARCTSCHGQNAEVSKYANARVLQNLSKQELVTNLTSYATDSEFGGSTKFIMSTQATSLTEEQIVAISAYIYSIKHKDTPKQEKTQDTSNDVIIDLDKKSFIK